MATNMTDAEKLQRVEVPFSSSVHNPSDQNGDQQPIDTTTAQQSPSKTTSSLVGPTWSSSEPSVAFNNTSNNEAVSMEQSASSKDMDLGSFDAGLADDRGEDLAMSCESSTTEKKFDITIGHIEDIIMEDQFHALQQSILEKYYHKFQLDTEENDLCYTDIHEEYVAVLEQHLESELNRRMSGFDMEEFFTQLLSQKEMLDGEIFEMLFTFTDFMAFKEMMLDYRREKEGLTVDLSGGLTVTSFGMGEPTFGINAQTIDIFPPENPRS